MTAVQAADIVSAIFILLMSLEIFRIKDSQISSRVLGVTSLVALFSLLIESFAYAEIKNMPSCLLFLFTAYSIISVKVILIAFTGYCYHFVSERTKSNSVLYIIPDFILTVMIVLECVMIFSGKMFHIEENKAVFDKKESELFDIMTFACVLYLPFAAFLKRKEIGKKAAFFTGLFGIIPVITTAAGFNDFALSSSSAALFITGFVLQNNLNSEKEKQLNLIDALSETYLNVYLVNILTRKIEIIKMDGYITDGLSRKKRGPYPYDLTCETYIKNRVYAEDADFVRNFMNWDNMVQGVNENRYYECTYRVLENNIIHHYQGRYRRLGKSSFVVCAFQNIDGLVQAESERNTEIQRSNEIIRTIAKSYHSLYYIDMIDGSFEELGIGKERIRNFIGQRGDTKTAMEIMCQKIVVPEQADVMREFTDITTLNERLKGKIWISHQFLGTSGLWSEGFFIAANRDEYDNCMNIVWAVRDINETKLKELAYSSELEAARIQAESASRAKTSFLFNMSHDIRTPMNAIMGYTNLLEKNLDNREKITDYIKKIQDSNEFLLSLINNVLEMARIESGKISSEETVCNVRLFNDTIYAVFSESMKEKELDFTRSIDIQHEYVICDATKTREIFLNLLSNAYKYTNKGGKVSISLKELPSDKENQVLFKTVVEDTGIGMSEKFVERLFDEFSRERTTTESSIEGCGLGMAIVKSLVDLLGGKITVESEVNKGTKITVILPYRLPDEEEIQEFKTPVSGEIEYDFSGKRVLVVEDNELNAEIAEEILKSHGFECERAENGLVCLEKLKKAVDGYYDLILMDIQMPFMNGYEAVREIRRMEDKTKASMPVIAMTANAFAEDIQEARKAGMNGLISKPLNVHSMMQTLSKILK